MRKWNPIKLWLLAVAVLFCQSASLANYTYDGLGRRIVFEDPVAAVTTRYYYDGRSVIEERDAADVRVRFHVNGAQFIDERVTTFEESTSKFTYYLVNQNFSVAGMGNADGSVIDRLDYSSTGDFAGGGPGAASFFHDADTDRDIDLRDIANLQNCFGQTDPTCLMTHDFDTGDASDGDIELDDYARFSDCFRGPFVTPAQICGQPGTLLAPPSSGTFGMHGRQLDVLSDGFVLQDFRARNYLPGLGRWLQRDPTGFTDGANLYESFRNNPLSHLDPSGEGILTGLLVGDPSLSDAKFIREGGLGQALRGFFGGGATASVNVVVGAGQGLKQAGLQVADTVVILVDIPATLAGFPIDFDPLSQLGQVSATTDDTLGLQLRVGGRAGANIVTLGAFNVVEGTIAFAQTGDAEALSRNVGGQGLIVLGTVGVARGPGLVRARSARPLVQRAQVAGGATRAGQQLLFPFAKSTPPRIVFRVIRPDETPALGLFAKNPSSSTPLELFVQRGRTLRTRFISTTRDINVARTNALRSGNSVIAIDLTRISSARIIDLSSEAARAGVLTNPRSINFARASGGVIIVERVPPQAILPFVPRGGTLP